LPSLRSECQCSEAGSSEATATGYAWLIWLKGDFTPPRLMWVSPWPLVARAQQQGKLHHVGILVPYSAGDSEYEARVRTMRETLARLGWIEGNNIQFDELWTTDDMTRIMAGATTLSAANPDVIVTMGTRVVPILLRLSRTIPIVLPSSTDPVSAGWVENLARPGGNITGFMTGELSIFGKILETLKQIAPGITRVLSINKSGQSGYRPVSSRI
jgi:putative ABC transport system substrate-binding protein